MKPIEALPAIETDDIIDGVRIVADNDDLVVFVTNALQKFAHAGYPIDNTEIRYDEGACDGAVGYHTVDEGHHLVVMCLQAEWTILHELGHVWSDQYMDEQDEAEWLERRGLDSWSEGDWDQQGTEHLAETVAFGLLDTAHTPRRVAGGYDKHVDDFEWLFGMEPLHRQRGAEKASLSLETTTRVTVVNTTDLAVETEAAEEGLLETLVTEGYTFPVACGYDRWHSHGGGYGYEDPRDWTHVGVDIYAYEGTPLVSPVAGDVVESRWSDVSGWRVVIEDRKGYRHVMVHMNRRPLVSEGSTVRAGQEVGEVGRTGNASGGGPHLHYEIREDGEPIDPMPWLRATGDHNVEKAPQVFHLRPASPLAACSARD